MTQHLECELCNILCTRTILVSHTAAVQVLCMILKQPTMNHTRLCLYRLSKTNTGSSCPNRRGKMYFCV